MEHQFISMTEGMLQQHLLQKDNNLDKADNLDQLPTQGAVFAICGRVNGQAANARYVGFTANLQSEIKTLFDPNTTHEDTLLKEFMLSIKLKMLVWQEATADQANALVEGWKSTMNPHFSEALNKVY
ncbi:MAG: hypothetical protein AAFQ98_04840 [Bacteroidota bacterium]